VVFLIETQIDLKGMRTWCKRNNVNYRLDGYMVRGSYDLPVLVHIKDSHMRHQGPHENQTLEEFVNTHSDKEYLSWYNEAIKFSDEYNIETTPEYFL